MIGDASGSLTPVGTPRHCAVIARPRAGLGTRTRQGDRRGLPRLAHLLWPAVPRGPLGKGRSPHPLTAAPPRFWHCETLLRPETAAAGSPHSGPGWDCAAGRGWATGPPIRDAGPVALA